MRVLQVHNRYALAGGEDVAVEADKRLLERRGHSVESYVVQNPSSGVEALAGLALAPANPRAARDVVRAAQAVQADVVHLHNTWFCITPEVLHALSKARVATVMTLHNYRFVCANGQLFRNGKPCTDCIGSGLRQGVRHRCYRRSIAASVAVALTARTAQARSSLSLAHRILVPSHFARNALVDAGLPESRLVVRHNVVEPFGSSAADRSDARVVLYAGRLSEEKGVDLLVDAWVAAGKALGDLELVIAGDGPLRTGLASRSVPGLRFVGHVDRLTLDALAGTARALVYPTQCFETFGLAAAQAMAAGLPVLASGQGAVAEVVQPLGESWLVSPPSSVDAWRSALISLTDDELVQSGVETLRRVVDAERATEASAVRLEAAYKSAIVALSTEDRANR